MSLLKHKQLWTATLVIALLFAVMFPAIRTLAAAIPVGCPGSTQQGPPSVNCAKIPAGCPGSTAQGAKNPSVKCPYDAPAATSSSNGSSTTCSTDPCTDDSQFSSAANQPGVNTCSTSTSCDFVGTYIRPAVGILSGLVGLVAAASIIFAGIQYSSAGGDPQKVAVAKGRIIKTITALIFYAFLYGLLQFLIPGGLFNHQS